MSIHTPPADRRIPDSVQAAEMHRRVERLENELTDLASKVDEVLDLLRASKLGLSAVKGLIALGLGLATAWAALKGIR